MGFISLTPGSTIGARQHTYEDLLGNQAAQYQHAADQASRRTLGDVASATQGTGNVLGAGRLAANASRDAQADLAARGAAAQVGINQRALEMAQADVQRQADQERQMVGGLLGGGGQVLGSVVGMMGGGPVGGQLGGNIGGSLGNLLGGGGAGGQQGGNPLSQIPLLGGLLGGGGAQQQQQQQQTVAPQTPPVAGPTPPLAVDPRTFDPSSMARMGARPAPGAMQRMGPDGQMHWYDLQGNIVG